MEEKNNLVVVLSRTSSTALNVIRALGHAGYTVDLIASAHKEGSFSIVKESKYLRHCVEVFSPKDEDGLDRELVDELLKYAEILDEKIVLFPTDDYTVAVVDTYRAKLETYFILPQIADERFERISFVKKDVQSEVAKSFGFNIAKQWIIELTDLYIPEDVVYPCFCKPFDALTGTKKDNVICEDEEALSHQLHKMRRKNAERKVIIQEYLDITEELFVSGVAIDQKIMIPGVAKVDAFAQYKKSVPLSGTMVPLTNLGEMQDNVNDLMKSFHYTGMFELELYVANDIIYFNEINFRSGMSSFAYLMSGANLPAYYVKAAYQHFSPAEDEVIEQYGKTFLYENIALIDCKKDFMLKADFEQKVQNADILFVQNELDPNPGTLFAEKKTGKKAVNPVRKIKRKIKRFIKKGIFPILRPMVHVILGYPQTKKANQRNPHAEKPRVVVCGRNYGSNLCIARALGQAGYEVEIMRVFHRRPKLRQVIKTLKPDAYSKYVKAYHTCIYGGKSWRVTRRLKHIADPDRKMLLIPADDLVACIADDYLAELSPYYVVSNVNNKAGEINRLMSKGVQKELALAAGLPVVNSCVIRTVNGEFEIPETVTYPCFIKPNISKNGSKTKMRRCDSAAELRGALEELCEKKDVEMLVEDFVEIAREYSILGISTKNGAIGPGFFVAEEGGQHEHRGIAITGKIIPGGERQQLIDDIVAFIGTLQFDGLYDVDLLETVDGKMYFIELNMRFGGSGYGVTASGVNLPGMYADYMLMNKPIDMNCKLEETGKRFVSEKVLIEEYINNRMTWDRVNEIINEVDIHFIKDNVDTRPYTHFKRYYPVAALMRFVYKMRDNFKNEEFEK